MQDNKRYWKGLEEYSNDIEFVKKAQQEFPSYIPMKEQGNEQGNSRRDFLKLMGFSVAAATLASCEAPVKKVIPFLNKPEAMDLSSANFYASTYFDGKEYCSILVKTREGRPIKIEGNRLSPVTKGGTNAKVQASVLSLYDDTRYKTFRKGNKEIGAEEADKEIVAALQGANNIALLTPTIISPSTKAAIAEFVKKYPKTTQIVLDPISLSGLLKANRLSFGNSVIPQYDFSKSKVIVSFGADFLGTWITPIEFARQYTAGRKLSPEKRDMSRHYQFEARLSLSGANADYRLPVKTSAEALILANLYGKLSGSAEKYKDETVEKLLVKCAADLSNAKGASLVVSGSNDSNVQVLVNAINNLLGNYGNTIDLNSPVYTQQGEDNAVAQFVEDINAKKYDAVIFYNTNPVYHLPNGKDFGNALKSVKTKISLSSRPDETTSLCDYVCPDHHYLESWNDYEPKKGFFSLSQPTISPLFKTRQAQESLLTWAGNTTEFYAYVQNIWNKTIYPNQKKYNSFEDFWNYSLHDGVFEGAIAAAPVVVKGKEDKTKKEPAPTVAGQKFGGDVDQALVSIGKTYNTDGKSIEVVLYEKISIGNGAEANNPWLQEMPDPISKACWDNYVAISQKQAKEMELSQGDVVKVEALNYSVELPVFLQPGQAYNTVSIALGYGREQSGKVGDKIGKNVFPFVNFNGENYNYFIDNVKITKTAKKEALAQTQTTHTLMGRKIVQEAVLSEYKDEKSFEEALEKYQIEIETSKGPKKPTEITLWKGYKYPNHSWGMVIDLNSCIGCGACTVACQAENNVPVVGKKEVITGREMHWIRIDRYYSNGPEVDMEDQSPNGFKAMERAAENPEVVFQPMMCQHCNNAPCETVCPVLATTHSSEGLNQMVYNRCIGTRYCANNCPYKVRRFNWFHYAEDDRFTTINYHQTSDLGRMVLNPEVTVRSRGVMEKCTLCVQRIQGGKLKAKKEKRKVTDADVQVACAAACPAEAITFGDMNNTESAIAQLLKIKESKTKPEHGEPVETIYSITENRAFHVLEEINVRPQVSYLTKIRNKDLTKKEGKA